jgi:hypothetical protein
MAAKPKEYRRLPGSGQRKQGLVAFVSIRSRLWLGKDHILAIDSMRFSEDYKRFYFRDIQAVIIRKTHSGRIQNLVFGVLALPPLGFCFAQSDRGGVIACLVIAGVFLACLLLNLLFGPTCHCDLQTAVQTERLPSLGRLWRARKVLARLRPLIAEAQGQLTREEIPARMAESARPAPAVRAPEDAPPVIAEAPAAPLQPASNPGEAI